MLHDSKKTPLGKQKISKKEVSDEESKFGLLRSTGAAALGHTKRVSIDTVATTDTGSGFGTADSDHKSNSSHSSAPDSKNRLNGEIVDLLIKS